MEEIKEKKKAQKAEAIAKAKFAARRSPRSRDVNIFYDESSKEEKKKPKLKPKPKPKMASPPKKRKIKVCHFKSFLTLCSDSVQSPCRSCFEMLAVYHVAWSPPPLY